MALEALIFVPALVGSVIFGMIFLTFASHYYLTVLESSAAGAKLVTWESSELVFNLWKVAYLSWLIGLWAGPAYFISRAAATGSSDDWICLAVPLLVMWAIYPVSQLASLSASSVWVPLNVDVFSRLVQKPLVTLGFFVLSLPVVALFGIAFKWSFLTNGEWHLLLVGLPLLGFASFLYARLLGRLAYALMFTRDFFKRKKKKMTKKEVSTNDTSDEPEPPAVQPSELPPLTTPLDGELTGYDVLIADDPPPVPKKRVKAQVADDAPTKPAPRKHAKAKRSRDPSREWTDEDDDSSPYSVNASEVKQAELVPEEMIKPRADEMALIDRRDTPKPLKQVWTMDLLACFVQPRTIAALLIFSTLGVFAGTMVRVARLFNPVAGAE